ncbi:MAG: pilus assembly protein PilM [Candidatus Omnitrophota bacterium]
MFIQKLFSPIERFISKKDDDFVIFDLGSRYLKALVVNNGKIKDVFVVKNSQGTVKSSVDLLREKKLNTKTVNISLQGPDTIVRYIPFAKGNNKNIKEIFAYELNKYLPFPADSVYFDIVTVDEDYSNEESLFLLAAAKKSAVNPLLEGFQKEKISIGGIGLNFVGLINILSLAENIDNAAIVDLGFSSTLFTLIKKKVPYLSREIKISGGNLLERAIKNKNISQEEAEEAIVSSSQPAEFLQAADDILVHLCEEIKSSLDYFEMNTGEHIKDLYLVGGFSLIKNIDKVISGHLGIKAKNLDFSSNNCFEDTRSLSVPKEMLAVVLGLSL